MQTLQSVLLRPVEPRPPPPHPQLQLKPQPPHTAPAAAPRPFGGSTMFASSCAEASARAAGLLSPGDGAHKRPAEDAAEPPAKRPCPEGGSTGTAAAQAAGSAATQHAPAAKKDKQVRPLCFRTGLNLLQGLFRLPRPSRYEALCSGRGGDVRFICGAASQLAFSGAPPRTLLFGYLRCWAAFLGLRLSGIRHARLSRGAP